MKEIFNLLNEINKLKVAHIDLSDNVFSVLEINDKEVFHCRFLKYLIKKDWKGFCEKVLGRDILCPDRVQSVEREFYSEHLECMQLDGQSAKDGRIDILCKTDKDVVAIEVKWYAEDQPQQLLRYYKRLETLFPKQNRKLVYLTLSGKQASSNSTKCRVAGCGKCCELNGSAYKNISFKEIKDWLKDNRNLDKEIVKQYCDILEEELNMCEVSNAIIAIEDNYYAATKVAAAVQPVKNTIREAFMKALGERILERFADMGIVVEENEVKRFKYDKNVERGECLAYRIKDKYLLVWATTALYWQLGESCKYQKDDKWSYIDKDWFEKEDAKEDTYESKNNDKKVDAESMEDNGNKIVELFFAHNGDKDEIKQDPALRKIVNNMYRQISQIINN